MVIVMNEQNKEALSALFDGETAEFETRRLLQELDVEGRARWQRYQLIRDGIKGGLAESNFGFSVSGAITEIMAGEPSPQQVSVAGARPWLKPLLGFATAASIGFCSVMLVLQLDSPATGSNAGFVANGNVSASQLAINAGMGSPGLNTVSGSVQTSSLQREIEAIDAQKLRDRERLKFYLQQHAQHASFNSGHGLMPMVRIADEGAVSP